MEIAINCLVLLLNKFLIRCIMFMRKHVRCVFPLLRFQGSILHEVREWCYIGHPVLVFDFL